MSYDSSKSEQAFMLLRSIEDKLGFSRFNQDGDGIVRFTRAAQGVLPDLILVLMATDRGYHVAMQAVSKEERYDFMTENPISEERVVLKKIYRHMYNFDVCDARAA